MIALLASGHGSCMGSQLCCPQTPAAGPACGTWFKKSRFLGLYLYNISGISLNVELCLWQCRP